MDKEMMLEAVDIIRTVADHQRGIKGLLCKAVNKLAYIIYKTL